MLARILRTLLPLLCLAPGVAAADPYVVYRHALDAAPWTEGWAVGDFSSPVTHGPVSGVSWFVNDASSAGGSRRSYSQVPDAATLALADSQGWTLRAELLVPNANDARDTSVWIEFSTGSRRWMLEFGSTAEGDAIVGLVGDASVEEREIAGGAVPHLYELVFDPQSETADLLVDGVVEIPDFPGRDDPAGGVRVIWGSGCSGCTGRGEWSLVEFEIDLPLGTPDGEPLPGIGLVPPLVGEVGQIRSDGPRSGRYVAASGNRVAISDDQGVSLYQRDGDGLVLEQRVLEGSSGGRVSNVVLEGDILLLETSDGSAESLRVFTPDPETGVWAVRDSFGSNGAIAGAVSGQSVYVATSPFFSGPQGVGGSYYLYCDRVDFVDGVRTSSARGFLAGYPSARQFSAVAGSGDSCLLHDTVSGRPYLLPLDGFVSGDREWKPVLTGTAYTLFSQLGRAMAERGDRLAVGALRNGTNQGAVLLFDRAGSEWVHETTLYSSDPDFGRELALDGDLLAVGSGPDGQQFELFEQQSGVWGTSEILPRAGGSPLATQYGSDLALSADRIYSGTDFGGATVFATSAADPAEVASYVRSDLYLDFGADPQSAPFRYREGLFPGGIRSALVVESTPEGRQLIAADTSADPIWGPAEREAAGEGECLVRFSLEQAPTDGALGELLLDIHYDRMAGDLVLAATLRREADRVRLAPPDPGAPVIDQEIDAKAEALDAYLDALAGGPVDCAGAEPVGYFRLLEDTSLTEDGAVTLYAPGVPAGYGVFQSRVPSRALLPAADELGQPIDGDPTPLFDGYKDLALVAGALGDAAELAEELSRLLYMRGGSGDTDEALALLEDLRTLLNVRGSQLAGTFGGTPDMPGSAIAEATAAYQAALTNLARTWETIANGSDPLGFDDDFLLLVNDPSNAIFDSYDVFQDILNSGDCPSVGTTSFLEIAACDFEDAQGSYDDYRLGLAELNQQFDLLNQDDALRLEEIGDDEQVGSEIWQQSLSIEVAALRVRRNRVQVSNLESRIRFEVERRAEAKKIAGAMGQIRLEYANRQARLTEKIGEINAAQKAADSATKAFEAKTFWTTVANVANGAVQAGAEVKKGQLQAEKEKLAALETAELKAQEGRLLDLESRTRIKNWLLEMNTLAIDSQEAAILLRQDSGRLVQLLREKEFLEQRVASRQASFGRRYYADPVFELRSDADASAANRSFQRAQEWLFYMARALEYKWIREYRDENPSATGFSMDAIYRLRNAEELRDFFIEMVALDLPAHMTKPRIDLLTTLSLRRDYLGLSHDAADDAAFFDELLERRRFGDDCNGSEIDLNVDQCIVIELSTVVERADFFFRGHFADKIKTFGLRVPGDGPILGDSLISEILYGGSSILRRPDPGLPGEREDRIEGESRAFSTKNQFSTGNGWESRPAKKVSLQVFGASQEGFTEGLQELSVAATQWRIMLPILSFGEQHLDLAAIEDVELFFDHQAIDR